ncbi:MAG: hypothetical protein WBR18_02365 [Anaerolineales bacterium]
MRIPFKLKLKWIHLKSLTVDNIAGLKQRIHEVWTEYNHALWRWMGLAMLLVVLAGCGPFGISFAIDQDNGNQPPVTAGSATARPETPGQATPMANLDASSENPQLVWMPFASGTTEDGSLIAVRPDKVGFEPSPVDFAMYWDYSGQTGKLAYASEFFHAARTSNTSVSDLRVYDYSTKDDAEWLPDNVARASWSPLQPGHYSEQRLAAAIFNTDEGRFDLGLVRGPGQVEWLASCASSNFAWSPDAKEIAYVAFTPGGDGGGIPEECQGVFIVSVEDGQVRQLSDIPALYSGWLGNRPLWTDNSGPLLFTGAAPKSVFWGIKTDGSEVYETAMGSGITEDYLPSPMASLWSPEHRSVIGQTEGMMDPWGVWVYMFSEDLRTIESAYRINWGDYDHDIILLGWWEPGESVLLRDITNTSSLNPFGVAMVWSLSDQVAFELSYSRPVIDVPLYPQQVRTDIEQVDQVIENFLVRKFDWRRDMIRTVTVACTTGEFVVGPPPCPVGVAEGTKLEVFPYREHRQIKYVTPGDLEAFLQFPLGGLYAVYRTPPDAFEEDWMPASAYNVVFVAQDGELGVEVAVDEAGKVVRIEFWPMTPIEVLDGADFEYVLPPASQ